MTWLDKVWLTNSSTSKGLNPQSIGSHSLKEILEYTKKVFYIKNRRTIVLNTNEVCTLYKCYRFEARKKFSGTLIIPEGLVCWRQKGVLKVLLQTVCEPKLPRITEFVNTVMGWVSLESGSPSASGKEWVPLSPL